MGAEILSGALEQPPILWPIIHHQSFIIFVPMDNSSLDRRTESQIVDQVLEGWETNQKTITN